MSLTAPERGAARLCYLQDAGLVELARSIAVPALRREGLDVDANTIEQALGLDAFARLMRFALPLSGEALAQLADRAAVLCTMEDV